MGKQEGRGLNINELSEGCQLLSDNCSRNNSNKSAALLTYGTQSSAVYETGIDDGIDNSIDKPLGNWFSDLKIRDQCWNIFTRKK